MKITSLEPQKKRKSRLNLFVDGDFVAGIDSGTAASLGLYVDKEIDEAMLSGLADEESYQLCLDKAFLLLSIRMQTEHELWQKLSKKFSKKDIGAVIFRLKELGYVDDYKFAKLWIDSRSRNHGVNVLRTELANKGIKKEIIDEILITIDQSQQLEAAQEIVKSKDKDTYSSEERFDKIGGMLSRRGFTYDIIKKSLEK